MLAALAADGKRNQRIVKEVVAEAQLGHSCLVLSGRLEHCELLTELIRSEGVNAAVLTGQVPKSARKRLIEDARAGRLGVLVATSLADEGLDLPRLSRLFLAYPSRARGRTMQRLGRLMRPHSEKQNSVLFDFVDSRIPLLRRHHAERRTLYREVLGARPLSVPQKAEGLKGTL